MSPAPGLEPLGESTPGPASALAEPLGDRVSEGALDSFESAFFRRESLRGSGASGVLDALGEPEGDASGEALGDADPLDPPDGFEVGLDDGDGLEVPDDGPEVDPDEEPDGELVGDDVGDGPDDDVGEEVGDGDGLGEEEAVTGAATPGGTLAPAARSCCHDQPTDPPAGTVSEPTP